MPGEFLSGLFLCAILCTLLWYNGVRFQLQG